MRICKHQHPLEDEEGKYECYFCDIDFKECNYQCQKEDSENE